MEIESSQFRDNSLDVFRRQRIGFAKACWIYVYYAVANVLPAPPLPFGAVSTRLRTFVAGRIFAKIGRDVKIGRSIDFGSGAFIEIGDRSSISRGSWISNDTKIGADVMMGPSVTILSGSHNFSDTTRSMRSQGASARRAVVIGDDVWIGTRAILLPGIQVGSHSIIGAGSVVTKNVPEWAIVAGNPARIIRSRKADSREN